MAESIPPKLSVIVANYNYARFVAAAIESLLSQSKDIEIIVVDDCSTDNSRDIISKYADQIITVFLEKNQGQGGGFNAGFERATGDLVMFLDADDFMLPGGAEVILNAYDPETVMYHYRMRYSDEEGNLGGIFPPLERNLASGDLSEKLRTVGIYDGTVTSGMVFSHKVLSKVLPMNPEPYRYGADGYLTVSVPLYGKCASSFEMMSAYRLHGAQHSQFEKVHAEKARWFLDHYAHRLATITEHSEKLGLDVHEDLASQNYFNVHSRLVSLLFDPQKHPFEGDRANDLARRAKRLNLQIISGRSLWLRKQFWNVLLLLPTAQKRALLRMEMEPSARPAWVKVIARLLRKRFKMLAS